MFDFLMPLSEILRSQFHCICDVFSHFWAHGGQFSQCGDSQTAQNDGARMARQLPRAARQRSARQTKYSIVTPRSACPSCGHQITALENIPIVSWLMFGGKCKGCKAKISMRYPLVEALTGALIGAVAYKYGYTYSALFAFVFVFALVALTFIDFDTQLLPDDITLPLLWLGLLFNLNGGFTDLKSAVLGAIFGYLILWSVYWLFKIVTGKEGMGFGDFKLLAAIGAWFGWQLLPAVILLSSVVGAVIGIGMIIFKGKEGGTAIPFGPFLALGGIAALFFGRQLASFYLG